MLIRPLPCSICPKRLMPLARVCRLVAALEQASDVEQINARLSANYPELEASLIPALVSWCGRERVPSDEEGEEDEDDEEEQQGGLGKRWIPRKHLTTFRRVWCHMATILARSPSVRDACSVLDPLCRSWWLHLRNVWLLLGPVSTRDELELQDASPMPSARPRRR